MPDIPPIDDLENLSATGAMLEGVLRQWVQDITECSAPDIVTVAEAIDFFSRLAAVRKTLIKLSRLSATPPRPSRPSPNANPSISPDPVSLPTPNIDQVPCVPDVPPDKLRPQLDAIAAALQDVCPTIPSPSDPSDPSTPHTSHTSHTSHNSHSSPHARDPRCVALNIHPIVEDTTGFSDKHPFFDRSLYGNFKPAYLEPWHRKKNRRFG